MTICGVACTFGYHAHASRLSRSGVEEPYHSDHSQHSMWSGGDGVEERLYLQELGFEIPKRFRIQPA